MRCGSKRCGFCLGEAEIPRGKATDTPPGVLRLHPLLRKRRADCAQDDTDIVAGAFWPVYHPCFMALANFCSGNVFNTSSLVSQARRACRMPKRILSMCEVWWESVLITIFTPCSLASRR